MKAVADFIGRIYSEETIKALNLDDLREVEELANNGVESLIDGIGCTAGALASALNSSEGLEPEQAAQVAWHLEAMANLAENMHSRANDMRFWISKRGES